jgi:hypothetical protein
MVPANLPRIPGQENDGRLDKRRRLSDLLSPAVAGANLRLIGRLC